MSAKILIIDDEITIRQTLKGILQDDEGHTIIEAESAEQGLTLLNRELPDLILLDIWLPRMDGLEALSKIQEQQPHLPIIMISGHGTIETAVAAIKSGAYDFIEKPLSLEKLLLTINRALEFANLKQENRLLKNTISKSSNILLHGTSSCIESLKNKIKQVAPTDAWVLLNGENGTGKEIAARAIHCQSLRKNKPLIAVNCAALPETLIESELFGHEKGAFTGAEAVKIGKFELAHNATLFLDEIADMSLKTQAKILRILQEQQFERLGGTKSISVNVRVIAASNKNLEKEISAGRFREDLYYRLKVFPLTVPPLRERGTDILLLADIFQEQLILEHGFKPLLVTSETKEALLNYTWPGNVRELKNFMERMLIIYNGQELNLIKLPPEILNTIKRNRHTQKSIKNNPTVTIPEGAISLKQARQEYEIAFLNNKLQECQGNISRLSNYIEVERSHLSKKLKNYGLIANSEQ